MSYSVEFLQAIDALKAGFEKGRLGHAYIVQGRPRGMGGAFVDEFLGFLLQDSRAVAEKRHPDVHIIEPESKSRILDVHKMRTLGAKLSQTSFSNGWKAGVVLYADRMNNNAANAFLKTLEEPSPRTILFLVTDSAGSMLPTITSRCQTIQLPPEGDLEKPWWFENLLALLKHDFPGNAVTAIMESNAYANLLREIEGAVREELSELPEKEDLDKKIKDARVSARQLEHVRHMMEYILQWRRDIWCLSLGEGAHLYFEEHRQILKKKASKTDETRAQTSVAQVQKILQLLERKFRPEGVFEVDQLQNVP